MKGKVKYMAHSLRHARRDRPRVSNCGFGIGLFDFSLPGMDEASDEATKEATQFQATVGQQRMGGYWRANGRRSSPGNGLVGLVIYFLSQRLG
jgi:hypothetical protein